MRRRTTALVLPLVAGLTLAACGGSPEPTAAPPPMPVGERPVPTSSGTGSGSGGESDPGPAAGDGSSRTAPLALDTPVQIGDWEVQVGASNLDADQVVADENMFNTPPDDGHTYVLVPLTVTYTGTGSGTAWLDLSVEYIGSDAVTYTGYCGVVPDALLTTSTLYEGGSVTANACAAVPTDAIEGGVWRVAESLNPEAPDAAFFASA